MKLSDFNIKDEEEIFSLEQRGEVPFLQYLKFQEIDWIRHCFTTRGGGVSKGIFESMNLSFTRGDDKEAVEENFRRIAKAMGTDERNFVFTDQTHTTNVRKVSCADLGAGIWKERGYRDVDGLITDEAGIVLSTFYADCVPLYFIDVRHHAIGLSHSGWRGSVGRMGKVTIEAMRREYGTTGEDLLCAIGPSICMQCYEVSGDVAVLFEREFGERAKELLRQKKDGKYLLDLWRANEIVLEEAGVPSDRIITTNICTCCNPNLLFSHRASKGKRGNLAAFLSIAE